MWSLVFLFFLHHPAMQSTLGVLQGYLVIHEIPLTERWQSKHRVMGLCFLSFFPLGDRKESMITSHDEVRWRRFLNVCFPHGNQLHAFLWQWNRGQRISRTYLESSLTVVLSTIEEFYLPPSTSSPPRDISILQTRHLKPQRPCRQPYVSPTVWKAVKN